jgi:hypothetical protein
LTTSLVEDVFTLLHTECSVLADLLKAEGLRDTRSGAVVYADGLAHVLRSLQQTHINCRLLFLSTLADCCAAANDFRRMSDSMERFAASALTMFPCLPNESLEALQQRAGDLVTVFSQDAVFAAERTQLFMMREVNATSIGTDYFSSAWEDDWTNNEVTLQLSDIFDEYMRRIQKWLGNDYLYHKALVIAANAMICFYIRCLINKADSVTRRRRNRERFHLPGETLPFNNHQRALRRLADDIGIMKEVFVEKAGSNVTSRRIIHDDIYILELICECLGATDIDSVESFIVVIHKQTGADALVTRYFVGDLWMLMLHRHARSFIRQTLLALKEDLQMVSKEMEEREPRKDEELSFVRLDAMLKVMYEDRLAQGVLPACWTCLPKVETEADDIVVKQIRSITRKMAELKSMKWPKKPEDSRGPNRRTP